MPSSFQTPTGNLTRELAAIMFSDVVGYTAIMGRDEQRALKVLAEHRAHLRAMLPRFNGRLIGEIGDGTLSSFHSVMDALACARELQAAPKDDAGLRLRIGVHLGDVVVAENTVLGDGVNVAARIHALAPPGGICISANVYDEIRNKPEFVVRDLGEQKLKNVARPIRLYSLALAGSPAGHPDATTRVRRAAIVAGAGALALAAAVYSGVARWRSPAPGTAAPPETHVRPIRSIAVLPLDNFSGDPGQEYFADGMTDELITDLAKISALRVISRSSVMQFKSGHRKAMPQIARELNVDAVVEGSVLRTGDKVRITAQLIDAPNDRHLWADSFERDSRDVLALQDDLAAAIAGEVNVQLTLEDQARSAKARPVNPAAYDAYLKGRYQLGKFTEQGSAHALQLFQQAIASDPKFAPAYAGIAEVYWTECSWTVSCAKAMAKAREAAAKAVELGGTSAESHYTLGLVYMLAFDWANAEREYRKALSLNPGFVDAHRYYGYWLMAQGKLVEAVGEFRKAQQLDPLSANLATEESFALMDDRKYEEAAEAIRRALYLDPNSWEPHFALATLAIKRGKPGEAISEGHKALALEDSPETKAWLAYAYAASGDRRNAQTLLSEMMKISGQRYVDPALVGIVHLGLGEKDRAFEGLEAGYEDHSGMLWMLKIDHVYDPLRSDPRFVELLKKVGLEK